MGYLERPLYEGDLWSFTRTLYSFSSGEYVKFHAIFVVSALKEYSLSCFKFAGIVSFLPILLVQVNNNFLSVGNANNEIMVIHVKL